MLLFWRFIISVFYDEICKQETKMHLDPHPIIDGISIHATYIYILL